MTLSDLLRLVANAPEHPTRTQVLAVWLLVLLIVGGLYVATAMVGPVR